MRRDEFYMANRHPLTNSRTIMIQLSCRAPEATAVMVAGTFNEWKSDTIPLENMPNGEWAAALTLPPGHHEYKFVVDGQWCCEPGCEHEYPGCPDCVANEFGTMNRVLEVS